MRKPEVLAPAGDEAALDAAIRGGADAVYFGLQGFNARARAANFDEAGLAATVRRLHEHGVKAYVALNTLVFDDELPRLEAAVRTCAAAGVDAVIVQDIGVAKVLREVAPELRMHASTQMTCTDASSVELAAELGARRVVLARELSLDDIASIAGASEVELEVFVHGALCVAYSGQCLTSEAIGGRSANRGACAQACRLPYELVVDGVVRPLGDKAYLLSPEDLEATAQIPRLAEIGVASLKIEGRMKAAPYVFATTRLYREAVTNAVKPTHRAEALQTYSRGSGPGFLAGVDHQRLVDGSTCDHRGTEVGQVLGTRAVAGKVQLRVRAGAPLALGDGVLVQGGFGGAGEIGGRIWTMAAGTARGGEIAAASAGDEVFVWLGPDVTIPDDVPPRRLFKTNDPAVLRALEGAMHKEPFRTPLAFHVRGRQGEVPVFEARSLRDGRTASVEGDVPLQHADRAPLSREILEDKLGRLGDTPFALAELTVDLPPDAMIPLSSLNRARRALTAALVEQAAEGSRAHRTTDVSVATLLSHAQPPDRAPARGGLFVLCRNLGQAKAALESGADGVYLDFLELTGTGNAVRELRAAGAAFVGVAPPRIRKPGEEKIDRYLEGLAPDAVLVRGLGALRERSPALRIGDFSLNVTNRIAAAEVLARGLAAFTPSFDLDASQLETLLTSPFGAWAEVVIHHPMPLFHMEHCVIAALLSEGKDHRTCGRPCDRHQVSLRDRAGLDNPVEADVGCRNTVFHAVAQSAATMVPRLQAAGVRRFRVELVREPPEETARVVRSYRDLVDGKLAPAEVWRGLRTETGYGVVRGSLRVLP